MTFDQGRETEPAILVRDEEALRVITLNRPAVRNAIDSETATGLEEALDEYARREDLRVAILAASGTAFSAGMDLKAFLRGERPSTPRGGFAGLVENPPRKPLIAAVDGHAVAGGFEIALACDLIVASRASSFSLPEVRRGLVAAGGGLIRLPARLPFQWAMYLGLTGQALPAEEAYRLGLVCELTEPGEALAQARRLAVRIASNGPLAVEATKRILQCAPGWPPEDAFRRQREITEPVRESADAHEGAKAFLDHRPPEWRRR